MDDMQEFLGDSITHGKLSKISRQLDQQNRPKGPPCPHCGGQIPKVGVKVCMHCRNKLSWVEHIPCEPGEEQKIRKL